MKSTFLSRNGSSSFSRSSDHGNKPFIGIQAKLNIGKPGDKFEKEADNVADKVVQRTEHHHAEPTFILAQGAPGFIQPRAELQKKGDDQEIQKEEKESIQEKPLKDSISSLGSAPPDDIQPTSEDDQLQAKCDDCGSEKEQTKVQMKCADCAELNDGATNIQTKCEKCTEKEAIQKKSNSEPSNNGIESNLKSSKGGGSPMSKETNSEMSSAFGADLGGVRIHTDSNAVQMNRDLGARAFTNGNDVYFNQGEYNPSSKDGKHLLAHELTHTFQQGENQSSVQKTEDPCAEPDEAGSESEAESNETAPAGEGCATSDIPIDQPSEGQEEPEGEEQTRDIEAQEGSPVDARQSHAPAADENAPESEEGIQEEVGEGTEEVALDPCALREQQGGGEVGESGEASEGAQEGEAQEDQGEAGNEDFLATAAQNGVSPLVNPAGEGEQASPEVLAEAEGNKALTEEQLVRAEKTKSSLNDLLSTPTHYRPDPKNVEESAVLNATATSFLSSGSTKATGLLDSGIAATEEIRRSVEMHRENLQIDISGKRKRTAAFFSSSKAQARAKAEQAKAQLNAKHIMSVLQIEMSAMMANMMALETYQTKQAELTAAHTTEKAALNQSYSTGHAALVATGNRMGRASRALGVAKAAEYRSAASYTYEGFWDGYVTYNRQMARVDSAREVGNQYEDGMKSQAQAQADQMMCGKTADTEFMGAILQKGLETLECAFLNSQDSIQQHKDGAIIQTTFAHQELSTNIDNALAATINQLEEKEAIQMQLLSDYGIRQAIAIERDGEIAVSSALTGINDAVDQLYSFLKEYKETITKNSAPSAEHFMASQEMIQAEFESSTVQTQEAIDASILSSQTSLDGGVKTAMTALNALYEQGISDGRQLIASYNTSIDGLVTAGTGVHDEIVLNATTSITGEQEAVVSMLTGIVTGITGLMSDITGSADAKFSEANTSMETGMQATLDGEVTNKICAEAEKAAADVSPWWVSALKVLLIIVVIVVVALVIGPAVIGAVGAAASAMAGSLGAGAALAGTIGAWAGPIIGGAIVGALAGATIQVGNNLIDIAGSDKELTWDNVTQGVVGAIIAGAIGGALGGFGGQFAQVILGRFGGALSQGWTFVADFGINMAFDFVGGILGDLAAGNTITLEGILLGMAIGGAVQVSMGGLGALARNSVNAPRVNADGTPTPRTGGRARVEDFAAKVESFQGNMMERGQNFGNRAGFGTNAPSADVTRQGILAANSRMQDGEFLPIRDAETSGPRTDTDNTVPDESVRNNEPETENRIPDSGEIAEADPFRGISEETRVFLDENPNLRQALLENPLAARFLKKCNSPCFPPEMTVSHIQRLES